MRRGANPCSSPRNRFEGVFGALLVNCGKGDTLRVEFATKLERFRPPPQTKTVSRVYTLCFFERGWVVPKVQLIDASTDDEAVEFARGSGWCSLKEVWDRHRLVAVIQPGNRDAPQS